MCTVVFDKLTKLDKCFEKSKRYFIKEFHVDIRNPKEVGGIGSFSLKNRFMKNKTRYTGESAGLQDFLWGYGMRYAIQSGYLAAKSIINKTDYEKVAKKQFTNKLKASVVNRYFWEKFSKNNYSFLIHHPKLMKKHIYSMHNYNLLQKIIFPLALSYFNRRHINIR